MKSSELFHANKFRVARASGTLIDERTCAGRSASGSAPETVFTGRDAAAKKLLRVKVPHMPSSANHWHIHREVEITEVEITVVPALIANHKLYGLTQGHLSDSQTER